jgi:membrane-associated protein
VDKYLLQLHMPLMQIDFGSDIFNYGGLLAACLIVYCSTGLFFAFFVPSGAVLFSAGVLAATGGIPHHILIVILFLIVSSVAGSWTGYLFGVYIGPSLYKRNDSIFFKRRHLDSAEKLYKKYGEWATSISFFLPIVRSFSPVIAGIGRLSFARFNLGAIAGSICWITSFVGVGYFIGIRPEIKPFLGYIVAIFICVVTVPVLIKIFRAFSRK